MTGLCQLTSDTLTETLPTKQLKSNMLRTNPLTIEIDCYASKIAGIHNCQINLGISDVS